MITGFFKSLVNALSTPQNRKKARTKVRLATAKDAEVEDELGEKIYSAGEIELTKE